MSCCLRSDRAAAAVAAGRDKEKEAAKWSRINVEEYLFLFLKFISSVIPTIEYDYTLSV